MLQIGDFGPNVIDLQNKLCALGLYKGPIDGQFGPETEQAVLALQVFNNLNPDGQVGPLTQGVLSANGTIPKAASIGIFPWQDWIRARLGTPEATGQVPTPFVLEIFKHTDYGVPSITPASCAATMCAALEETGYLSPHNASAISFKDYGTKSEFRPGCIVVLQHPNGGHHVTTCDHIIDNETFAALGGNQGHKICIAAFNRSEIIATRWPIK